MSTLRNTGDGEATEVVPRAPDKTELSPEEAQSILAELAST
jgi:hypothetical protein